MAVVLCVALQLSSGKWAAVEHCCTVLVWVNLCLNRPHHRACAMCAAGVCLLPHGDVLSPEEWSAVELLFT